jgi:long-chain acyl-CoA synthetase
MLWDPIVFKNTKAALGGRCRYMLSGSAPLSSAVNDFMKATMACPLYQGYG